MAQDSPRVRTVKSDDWHHFRILLTIIGTIGEGALAGGIVDLSLSSPHRPHTATRGTIGQEVLIRPTAHILHMNGG